MHPLQPGGRNRLGLRGSCRFDSALRLQTAALFTGLLLLGCCPGEQTDERGWPKELVLGLVPALEAEKLVDNLEPLTDHLSAELGVPVRSFVPQDYTGLVEALGAGRADIGMLPPFAAMLAARRYDIEPILISTRKGETGYRSQWMTNDRSTCETEPVPDDTGMLYCEADIGVVAGESLAYTNANSTSGYLFPALQLLRRDIDPQAGVDPIFVGAHDAVVLAVHGGDVRFGVAYDDARHMVEDEYPDVGEKVIVFAEGPLIPNDGVQVRPGLPDDLEAAIRQAFIDLAESQAHLPDEEKVLWVLYEIDGFAEVPEGLYDPVEEAYDRVRR